jgi:poly(hydroxyalkanoate) granule-associated protein
MKNMPTKQKVEETPNESSDQNQSSMLEMLRKVLLATIGAAAIATEEIEALVKRLVERGEIAEKDGKKLIHELMDKRKNKTSKIEEEIGKNIESVLGRMNISSKADVEAINQKIAALSKKIDELKKA